MEWKTEVAYFGEIVNEALDVGGQFLGWLQVALVGEAAPVSVVTHALSDRVAEVGEDFELISLVFDLAAHLFERLTNYGDEYVDHHEGHDDRV